MNISNLKHAKENISPALEFHGYYSTHQNVIPHILPIKKKLSSIDNGPMYLSFPSGSRSNFTFKRDSKSAWSLWDQDPQAFNQQIPPDFAHYNMILPVLFLKAIENGKIIVSLENAKPKTISRRDDELLTARYFYDVPNHQFLHLGFIKKSYAENKSILQTIRDQPATYSLTISPDMDHFRCIFFVKGASQLYLTKNTTKIAFRQRYGCSYQMFNFLVSDLKLKRPRELILTISSEDKEHGSQFLGPFFILAQQGEFNNILIPVKKLNEE